LRGDNGNMVSEIRTSDGSWTPPNVPYRQALCRLYALPANVRFSQWTSQTIDAASKLLSKEPLDGVKNIAENLNLGLK
jgi:hypothetical protein